MTFLSYYNIIETDCAYICFKKRKYLGDIISNDGKNQKNITDRTNKTIGNINRIESTLRERHYGRHYFKAFRLMREGLLLGGLLNNVEIWINVS